MSANEFRVPSPESRVAGASPEDEPFPWELNDLGASPPPAEAQTVEVGQSAPASHRPIARKEYYAISEVCDLVGLKPHVLRYWESQFPALSPSKNRSGNRVYQRKEIRLILLVKQLLYDEKYTVEGARAKLDRLRRGAQLGQATAHALEPQMIQLLREDLDELNAILTPPAR